MLCLLYVIIYLTPVGEFTWRSPQNHIDLGVIYHQDQQDQWLHNITQLNQ